MPETFSPFDIIMDRVEASLDRYRAKLDAVSRGLDKLERDITNDTTQAQPEGGGSVKFDTATRRRFWAKVAVNGRDACWLWRGGVYLNSAMVPYGRMWLHGRTVGSHRIAWTFANGAIPDGMMIMHRCDTPLCVNPRHLFIGTHQDNMQDMEAKGRGNRPRAAPGERNGNARLTRRDVRKIRKLYAARLGSYRQIGSMFGVCRQHICRIVQGGRWKRIAPTGDTDP